MGFKYIENESFDSTFQGLFSEINLTSEKLGKRYAERNNKLCDIIKKIAEGLSDFFLVMAIHLGMPMSKIRSINFAAGFWQKAGEFYTPT